MTEEQAKAVRLGVIGGSGVYQMEGVEVAAEHELETPFGPPSDILVETRIGDRPQFGDRLVLILSERMHPRTLKIDSQRRESESGSLIKCLVGLLEVLRLPGLLCFLEPGSGVRCILGKR